MLLFSLPMNLLLIGLMMTSVSSMPDDSLNENDMEMRQANSSSQSTWAQLQIKNKPTTSMPYGNYRINIYAQSSNTKESPTNVVGSNTYYYAPLMLLDHMSANSSFNRVTLKSEMSFRIWFWTKDVQDAVVKHIQTKIDASAQDISIQVIPFERVILSTTASTPTPGYTMPADWIPYQMNQFLKFKLSCFKQETCDDLASLMKTAPEDFSHFLMLFDMSSSKAETTKIDISVANLQNGNLASKLIQKLPNADMAYLTAADAKQLLVESSTKIIVNSFSDKQVVDANSQEQIMNLVQNLLIAGQTTISSQSSNMWNSVFWNQDNYRPDVASSTFNSIYNKLDTTNQKAMSNSFSNSKSDYTTVGFKFGIGELEMGPETTWGTEVTKSGTTTKDELNKLMTESAGAVMWNGTAFSPKPLSLSMVNMNKLKNTQSFQSQTVQVSYTNAILSLAINSIPSSGLLATATNPAIDFQLQLNAIDEKMVYYLRIVVEKILSQLEETKEAMSSRVQVLEKPVTGPMATGCADLTKLGHLKNGIYTVKSASNNNKLATVHCDFTQQPGIKGYETVIGYLDIKTSSPGIAFFVRRTALYSSINTVIPYQEEQLNIGDAMKSSTGVFTAPVNGRYHFSFKGYSYSSSAPNTVYLRLNNVHVSTAAAMSKEFNMVMFATLNLKKGDLVDTFLNAGSIYDSAWFHTQFSGFLLEEDLVLP